MSQTKQWQCPTCEMAVSADTLLDYSMGGELGQVGRWYVRGRCPYCHAWIQFMKHGASVLPKRGKPGYPATVITKHVKGEYME